VRRLLAKVRDGELGTAPAAEPVTVPAGDAEPLLVRAGWL
jgi:hypothetical protein